MLRGFQPVRAFLGTIVGTVRRTEAWQAPLRLHKQGDYRGALTGWLRVIERDNRYQPLCLAAACARELGQIELCEDLIRRASRSHPDNRAVLAEQAFLAARKHDNRRSAELWERIATPANAPTVWLTAYGNALLALGRLDQLGGLVATWRARHPDCSGFLALQAMLASARQDHGAALDLWNEFRAKHPDDPILWEHYGRSYQARQISLIEGEAAADPVEVRREEIDVEVDADKRALLLRFESLGHNCEFGLLQRRFGAEPLGLLRFNSVQYGDLMAAIAHRFERMGEPDVTALSVAPNGEFYVCDRRWNLLMHTFIFEGQQDPGPLLKSCCRRIAYFRDKFLSDLAAGEKILVYTWPHLSLDALGLLHQALRSLGPVTLLHVAFRTTIGAGLPHDSGTEVVRLADGLLFGCLGEPGLTPAGHWDIRFDEWIALCENAVALRQAVHADAQAV